MSEVELFELKQTLNTLNELDERYKGRTVDNVIAQLRARVEYQTKLIKETKDRENA